MLHEQTIQRETLLSEYGKGWLTEEQIYDLYKCRVVTAAVLRLCREDATLWRRHPDIPAVDEAVQYWVTVSESQVKRFEDILQRGISFQGKAEMPDALQLAQKMRAGIAPIASTSPASPAPAPGTNLPAAGARADSAGAEASEGAQDLEQPQAARARQQHLVQAQKERQRAQAAADRQVKAQKVKDEKAAHKLTPLGKGETWCNGCSKKISDISVIITQCDTAVKVEEATRNLYKHKFQNHHDAIKDLRNSIEEAIKGNKSEEVADELASADRTFDAFKADRQAWSLVFRLACKAT